MQTKITLLISALFGISSASFVASTQLELFCLNFKVNTTIMHLSRTLGITHCIMIFMTVSKYKKQKRNSLQLVSISKDNAYSLLSEKL